MSTGARQGVKFTINNTGSVIEATIKESTLKNPNVESCITKKIKHWIFPAPKGGGLVVVVYPFVFKSG